MEKTNFFFLKVDTELTNSKLNVQPYIAIPFGDQLSTSAYQFQPIAYELDVADAEPGCCNFSHIFHRFYHIIFIV